MNNGKNKPLHKGKVLEEDKGDAGGKKRKKGKIKRKNIPFKTPPMATKANLIRFAKAGLELYKEGRKITLPRIQQKTGLTYEEISSVAKYISQTQARFHTKFLTDEQIKKYKERLKKLERTTKDPASIIKKLQRFGRISIFEIETNGERRGGEAQNYRLIAGRYLIYYDNSLGIPYLIPISGE